MADEGEHVVIGGRYHSPEIAGEITAKLLDLSDPPTAIMYPDDFSYLGGVAEIRNRGLSVPEDISVTGYDGINLASVVQPALATWRQNAEEIGRLDGALAVSPQEDGTLVTFRFDRYGRLDERDRTGGREEAAG